MNYTASELAINKNKDTSPYKSNKANKNNT